MGFLRILLAVAVFCYHVGSNNYKIITPIGGLTAVFCFFVISGFYMGMVLTEKYTKAKLGDRWVVKFYIARYFRLWPLYFLAVIATSLAAFLGWVDLSPRFIVDLNNVELSKLLYSMILWFSNLTMLGLNIGSTADNIVPPSWTLGVELGFYLLAPWLVSVATKSQLVVFFAMGVALQFVNYGQHSPLLFGMHCFLMGIFSYRLMLRLKDTFNFTDSVSLKVVSYLVFIGLIFMSLPKDIDLFVSYTHAHSQLDKNLYPIVFLFLLPFAHLIWSKSKLDFYLGQISYPFYVFHQLFIDVFAVHLKINVWLTMLMCVAFSYLLIWLESMYLEPFRRKYSQ